MAAISDRIDALDWTALREQLDENAACVHRHRPHRHRGRRPRRPVRGRPLSLHDRHGPSPLRRRALPLLRPPAARADREARERFYSHLAPVANHWEELLGGDPGAYPATHAELLERCAAAGQTRPTPLMLRYRAGDWNALHQDLYGDVFFPFQVVTVLSEPRRDFTGGQFVLTEQRPRAQSRAHVLEPARGSFVIFPTRRRPQAGKRGHHQVGLRHGVSTVHSGSRTALGHHLPRRRLASEHHGPALPLGLGGRVGHAVDLEPPASSSVMAPPLLPSWTPSPPAPSGWRRPRAARRGTGRSASAVGDAPAGQVDRLRRGVEQQHGLALGRGSVGVHHRGDDPDHGRRRRRPVRRGRGRSRRRCARPGSGRPGRCPPSATRRGSGTAARRPATRRRRAGSAAVALVHVDVVHAVAGTETEHLVRDAASGPQRSPKA